MSFILFFRGLYLTITGWSMYIFGVIIYLVFVFPMLFLFGRFFRDRKMVNRMAVKKLNSMIFRLVPWLSIETQVKSIEKGAIYTANHSSLIDLMICFAALYPFGGFAKRVLFYVPGLGIYMRNSGFIKIIRNDPVRLQKAYAEAKEALRNGDTFLIFPEGTRSNTEKLGKFKKGAFMLSIEADVPIVPVVIINTGIILPKGRIWMNPDKINRKVIIETLDPIVYSGDPELPLHEKIKLLKKEVYDCMQKRINEYLNYYKSSKK